jgi:hypothetical protein
MVLCPVALAVGCKKCPVFAICPAKSIIGDYQPDEDKDDDAKTKEKTASREKRK